MFDDILKDLPDDYEDKEKSCNNCNRRHDECNKGTVTLDCNYCNGTGEGLTEYSSCGYCRSGTVKRMCYNFDLYEREVT